MGPKLLTCLLCACLVMVDLVIPLSLGTANLYFVIFIIFHQLKMKLGLFTPALMTIGIITVWVIQHNIDYYASDHAALSSITFSLRVSTIVSIWIIWYVLVQVQRINDKLKIDLDEAHGNLQRLRELTNTLPKPWEVDDPE